MEQRVRLAVVKDAPIKQRREEFVLDTVQRRCSAHLKGCVSAVVTETEIVMYIYRCTMKSKCR